MICWGTYIYFQMSLQTMYFGQSFNIWWRPFLFVGVFKYNSCYGTAFLENTPQSQQFRTLKNTLRRHFKTPFHIKCMKSENNEKLPSPVYSIAYYCLKSSLKLSAFTELIYMQALSGTGVGNINHSTYTYQKLRTFY